MCAAAAAPAAAAPTVAAAPGVGDGRGTLVRGLGWVGWASLAPPRPPRPAAWGAVDNAKKALDRRSGAHHSHPSAYDGGNLQGRTQEPPAAQRDRPRADARGARREARYAAREGA